MNPTYTSTFPLRLNVVGIPDARYEARFERRAKRGARGRPG